MNINLALHIWVLCGLFSFRFTASFQDFGNHVDVPYQSQSYNRFVEIEKHCESVISLASELKPYDNRGYRLKNELSFFDGDWEQDNGGSPLMPFYDTDIPQNSSSSVLSPYKLVSFEVNNVDPIRSTKTMIVLSGVLSIGITKDEKVRYDHYQDFYMRSGQSNLGISFEGVYVESEKNGGERLLCLLGNTSALPSFKGVIDPQKTVKEYISNYKNRPPLLQEDQILLVLRYPRIFTFRTRVIHGELKSLREESNLGYFDNVQISSQLGKYSEYQFMTKGYTAYPDHHRSTDDGIKFSSASLFCRSLQMWTSNEVLNIIPNWKCSDKDCSKWPHSIFGSEIWSASRNFDNITLIMQNVKCEEETKESGVSNARVGIVFRLLPSSARKEIEEARTGPGLTLAAEGVWKFYAVPDPLPGGQPLRTRIEFAVISLGPLFGPLAYDIYICISS